MAGTKQYERVSYTKVSYSGVLGIGVWYKEVSGIGLSGTVILGDFDCQAQDC